MLRFRDSDTMTWSDSAASFGSGTAYDVMRGVVGQWPVGSGPGATCIAQDGIGTSRAVQSRLTRGQCMRTLYI
jgi:hypothetical protein